VVLLAGMLVWLIIFVACLPAGVTFVFVWFFCANTTTEAPDTAAEDISIIPKASVVTIINEVVFLIIHYLV